MKQIPIRLRILFILMAFALLSYLPGNRATEAQDWTRNTDLPISVFVQQAFLESANTHGIDDFGYSIAIDGDTAVVGAPSEDSNATGVNGDDSDNSAADSGAAYVFVRDGGVWTQQAYLKASNTDAGDQFGYSVAIDGDTVVVGAWSEDSAATSINGNEADNSVHRRGAAYVFVRDGTTWSQQAYLKASRIRSNGTSNEIDAFFGSSVAIDGNTVAIGAPGEAATSLFASGMVYVFVRDGTSWSEQADLKAPNEIMEANFGTSVSVSGDTLVSGAPGAGGAVYAFVRSGVAWSEQASLRGDNTDYDDVFGASVALDGDTMVVGAVAEDSNATTINGDGSDNSATMSGAAYIFVRDGTVWSQQAYLKGSDVSQLNRFGNAVSLWGDTVIVGTNKAIGTPDKVYVFVHDGADWHEQDIFTATLTEDDSTFGGGFAQSVDIDGDTLVAGSRFDPNGAAYIFENMPPLQVELSAEAVSVTEGDNGVSATPLMLLVSGADRLSTGTRTIDLMLHDGTAALGSDYLGDVNTLPHTVTIPSGDYTTVQSVPIPWQALGIIGDTYFESDETFTVSLMNPSRGAVIFDANNDATLSDDAEITIINDDNSANLLINPAFNYDSSHWGFFGNLSQTWINGTVEWYRIGWRVPVMYQIKNYVVSSGAVIEAAVDVTNNSAVTKTVALNIRNTDYSQQMICAVTLNPGQTSTISLSDATTSTWARIHYTVRTFDRDNLPSITVDNALLRVRHDLTLTESSCSGGDAVIGTDYLLNGDFSFAGWRYWQRWGDIVSDLTNEELSFYLPSNAVLGGLFTRVQQYFNASTHLQLTMDVTNNTGSIKRFNALLREEVWKQYAFCDFDIAAGSTNHVTVRLTTNTTWGSAVVSLRPLQADGVPLVIDNVSLTPVASSGDACTNTVISSSILSLNAISAPPYINGEYAQFTLSGAPDNAQIALDCDADGIFESDGLACPVMSETVTAQVRAADGAVLGTASLELKMMSITETLTYLETEFGLSGLNVIDMSDAQAFDALFALSQQTDDPMLASWLNRLAYAIYP